jgi:hypothetical protein
VEAVGTAADAGTDLREPLLVLDKELRVLAASRSFYLTFEVTQDETGRPIVLRAGRPPMGHPGLYEGNSHTTMLLELRTSPPDVPWSGKGKTCFASSKVPAVMWLEFRAAQSPGN